MLPSYQLPTEVETQSGQVNSFLHPGPVDNSVLVLQKQHRSESIWFGEDPGVLTCRQRLATMIREWELDHRIRRYIIQLGFYGIYSVGFIQIDWPLITALVERWRQETHSFHFVVGESTVTLQDVALLLGLPIHGHAVTGKSDLQWDDLCEELLGLRPDRNALHGSALKLSWLRANFQHPPSEADEPTLQRYARAYVLGLMGGVLFTDKSGADVQLIFLPLLRDFACVNQFSWGSAVLAHLYRELCRATKMGANEIAGPLVLLQLWAWERLCIGRPERFGARAQGVSHSEDRSVIAPIVGDSTTEVEQLPVEPLGCKWRFPVIRRDNPQRALIYYRDQLDQQTNNQMIWQPYTPERLASLPDTCVRDQHVWRTMAPLVCFDIVEWHRPDRVLRQFGLHQGIPTQCDTEVKLHAIDRRGRHHYDWRAYHEQYIQLWEAREESIATGEPDEHTMHYHDPYMQWYRSITRRMITPLTQIPHMRIQPSSGMTHLLVQSLTSIHNQCNTTLEDFNSENAARVLTDIQSMCTSVLQMIGETRHLEAKPLLNPTTSTRNSSPGNTNVMQRQTRQNHEEVEPLLAHSPITTKAQLIRGRGRGKNRGRGSASQCLRTQPLSYSSPLPVVLLSEALPHGDDFNHLLEPAHLAQVENEENEEETETTLNPIQVFSDNGLSQLSKGINVLMPHLRGIHVVPPIIYCSTQGKHMDLWVYNSLNAENKRHKQLFTRFGKHHLHPRLQTCRIDFETLFQTENCFDKIKQYFDNKYQKRVCDKYSNLITKKKKKEGRSNSNFRKQSVPLDMKTSVVKTGQT
ncbi:hypothetical protein UlMin_037314 [Ulmus minor]